MTFCGFRRFFRAISGIFARLYTEYPNAFFQDILLTNRFPWNSLMNGHKNKRKKGKREKVLWRIQREAAFFNTRFRLTVLNVAVPSAPQSRSAPPSPHPKRAGRADNTPSAHSAPQATQPQSDRHYEKYRRQRKRRSC